LEREIEDRKDAENETKSLCKDVDQATLVRVELEGKVESLREELDVVRRAKDEVQIFFVLSCKFTVYQFSNHAT